MRLLSVVNAPVYGGGHNQIARLMRPLAERGWETLALVPNEPGNARARLEAQGVEVVAIPLGRLRAALDPRVNARFVAGFRREVRSILRLVRERGIDLVQAHGVTHWHAPLAAHVGDAAVAWELYDTRAPMALRRLSMPFVTRVSDVITTWGHELARMHPGSERLGERLLTVYPPVDARVFRPDEEGRRRAREELDVPPDAPLVGSIGNLNPQKGHEYLIRAVARLSAARPDVQVRIVGAAGAAHAGYRLRLEREADALGLRADGRLRFVGGTARVAELLPGLDVLVLTSVPRSEGMPTVIVEAMACGVPVVATDVAAIREVVEDGVTGLMVPPADPCATAEAIATILGDRARAERMGRAGRERVLERYDLERCADVRARAYGLAMEHRERRSAR